MMSKDKLVGFVMTGGHLDIEWYQPLRSYRFWTIDCFSGLKEAAKRDDFACYILDGQVYPLEEYLETVPQDEEEMRRYAKDGKLAIGPFYTQFDEWLPSPENIIRNCLYGKRRADKFGGYMKAGWLPDNFGHPLQMPQMLRGFGIDSFLFTRGMPEIPEGHPDEFIFRGLDGSEVLTIHFREDYSGGAVINRAKKWPTQPRTVPYYDNYLSFEWHKELAVYDNPEEIAEGLIASVNRIKDRFPSGIVPIVLCFDHMPPQINAGESVKAANEHQKEIEFVSGNVEEYIKRVYESYNNGDKKLNVYDMELLGSRYQWIILGVLNTHCYLKHDNFACEALMEKYVEPLDALASFYGYKDKPELIDEAWKYLLMNSAHDSIHGNSVDEVHQEMKTRYASVKQIASGIIHEILAYCGQHSGAWQGDNGRIISYAPYDPGIPQPVELWLPVGNENAAVKTEDGSVLSSQILPREEIQSNGRGEPRNDFYPYGIYRRVLFMDKFAAGALKSHAVIPSGGNRESDIKTGDNHIENEFIRIESKGALISLLDKKNNKWYHNLNLLEEEADAGDATDFAPPWMPGETVKSTSGEFTCSVTEMGPVRAVLEIRGTISVPLELSGDIRSKNRVDIPLVFSVSLYAGTARADVRLKIENTARDHRIRLHIMPNIRSSFVRSQSHFAVIDRPVERPKEIERWYQSVTQILPFREWLAVHDGRHGLCLAVKGMYDYEAVNNPLSDCPDIFVTLLRGYGKLGRVHVLGRADREGDWPTNQAVPVPGAQCGGIQEFEWSYVPYSAETEEKAPFLPLVLAYLYPPVAHAVRAPHLDNMIPDGRIFFDWKNKNIQFSAFKIAYDRDSYILRVYENQGRPTQVKMSVSGFGKAWLSGLDERTGAPLSIDNGIIEFEAAPYKIITIKLAKEGEQ
jgi:alpha-mannosidase